MLTRITTTNLLILNLLLCCGCASTSTKTETPARSTAVPDERRSQVTLAPELEPARRIVRSNDRVIDVVGEFYIPADEEWVFASDVTIRSTAQLVVDGILRCEPPTSPDMPAPDITLVSFTGIVIRGEVRPTQGFDGVVPGQAGGDAGKLTLAAPIIVSRSPFQGARGGFGAPGGDGGTGGEMVVFGATIGPVNQTPGTPVSQGRAGDGGIGGPARYFEAYPDALRAGNGGNGGNASGGPFVLADWDGPLPGADD